MTGTSEASEEVAAAMVTDSIMFDKLDALDARD
jgi:hypothetical protein